MANQVTGARVITASVPLAEIGTSGNRPHSAAVLPRLPTADAIRARVASTASRATSSRVGSLVAQEAVIAFLREQPQHLGPTHQALPGRQPVCRPLHARGDRRRRNVAVLERRKFLGRDIGEAAPTGAATFKMVGVEQHPGVRPIGSVEDLAQGFDAVDDGMLRVELDRELEPVLAADVGAALEVLDCVALGAGVLAGRAHHQRAIERDRVLAGFLKHVEQPFPLGAGRKQPAVFAAERADRDPRGANEVQHLTVLHALLEAAHEIEPAQLDRVEASGARGGERMLERRGVDRPGVQRQTSKCPHQRAS
jgi:hypothetical protein